MYLITGVCAIARDSRSGINTVGDLVEVVFCRGISLCIMVGAITMLFFLHVVHVEWDAEAILSHLVHLTHFFVSKKGLIELSESGGGFSVEIQSSTLLNRGFWI